MPDMQPVAKPIGEVWKIAGGGSLAMALAAVLDLVGSASATLIVLRVLLTLGGALAIGVSVYLRPQHIRLYVLACVMAVLARFGFPAEWDSGRLLSGFGAIVAGVGAVLVALPTNYRKIAASALMLLHFGGILSAVTGPQPQPWISAAVGVLVYRPYVECVYLTNAYHFYSPEPGTASQVWFCVRYKPDAAGQASVRWYKFPRRPEDMTDPLALSYYRRLSLTMRLENMVPATVTDDMKRVRVMLAQGDNRIPIHQGILPLENQYRLPSDFIRDFYLPSYVRHIANQSEFQHGDGVTPIDTIKVYRVEHRILLPINLMAGEKPYDPTTYLPYYQGEFTPDGQLSHPYDPLLYWLIPIVYEPKSDDVPPWHTALTNPEEFVLIDGLKQHTGSDHNASK